MSDRAIVTGSARVRVTVEIRLPDSWGPDCQLMQVHEQAKASALQILRAGMNMEFWRIVDDPVVVSVTTEPKR